MRTYTISFRVGDLSVQTYQVNAANSFMAFVHVWLKTDIAAMDMFEIDEVHIKVKS